MKKLRVLAVEETEMENRMFALYHKDRYVPKTVRTMLAEIAGRKGWKGRQRTGKHSKIIG